MFKYIFTALVEDSLESIVKILHLARQAQSRLLGMDVKGFGVDGLKLVTLTLEIKKDKAEWLVKKLLNTPTVIEADCVMIGKSLIQEKVEG